MEAFEHIQPNPIKMSIITFIRPPGINLILPFLPDKEISRLVFTIDLFTRKKSDGSLTPRRIGLSRDLGDFLKSLRRRNLRAECIFLSDRKDHQPFNYTWARKRQKEVCERAEVEYFSLHCWRHYYASRLISKGYDIGKIQALLGH